MSDLEMFEKAVRQHDFYYHYSDDHRVWMAGVAASSNIDAMAKRIGGAVASKIYNRVVDERLGEKAVKFHRSFGGK